MIDTRGEVKPQYVDYAIATVKTQSYAKLGMIVVNNRDRGLSIGAAWNLAVRHSKARFVFFLGDDDHLFSDCIAAHVNFFLQAETLGRTIHAVSSGCLAFTEDNRPISPIAINHTGLYDRAWLEANPFNETLDKKVDTEMHLRLKSHDPERTELYTMRHYYGYGYRQHPWMVSGPKVVFDRKGQMIQRR